MQTTTANFNIAVDTAIARRTPTTSTDSEANAFVKMLVRKWEMIGVITLMSASGVYAVSQLMTVAR